MSISSDSRAPVVDIQRFSIHDGPGIRTLVFFKGCPLDCAWCQNPESKHPLPVVAFYRDRCRESFDCLNVCPVDAVLSGPFRIDYDKCDGCAKCAEACAFQALRLIGEFLSPEDLLERIRPDLPYYRTSGGGVTFSGGEPTMHADYLERVIALCRDEKIHTTLETSGMFSFEKCAGLLKSLVLIYFDLKLMDPEEHKTLTGRRNDTILKNARRLVQDDYPVEFRLPLVPGMTDTRDNLLAATVFLRNVGQSRIHLLKYHNMGETKIDIIRSEQQKLELENYPEDKFEEVREFFESAGVAVSHHE